MSEQHEPVVVVQGVTKAFRLPHEQATTVKSLFTSIFNRSKRTYERQLALKNISFEINKGEFFGIVGRNGSGKSTLLKLLAGIYQPTKGKVSVSGKLVPFIELGVGFNPELTGRENVYLNGALLNFSRKEIDDMYDEIVQFAELENFMDQKLKNYSSGMQVRLAFSMAIRAKADILLVDEVLAVGDADFQRKCFEYFRELKRTKSTVVFVSHDMGAVREYCDRVALINNGVVEAIGEPETVAKKYSELFMNESDELGPGVKKGNRIGDFACKFEDVKVDRTSYRSDKHPEITLTARITARAPYKDEIAVGFLVKNSAGISLTGTNTYVQQEKLKKLNIGESLEVSWKIPNIFGDGKYTVDTAITSTDGATNHDWWVDSVTFKVYREQRSPYAINPDVPVFIKELKK